jgi:hypothetical protein
MQGIKTYTGILISFLGVIGVSKYFSADEVAQIADLVLQVVGLGVATYGRYVAKPEAK